MSRRQIVGYIAVLAACFLAAYLFWVTPFGTQVDNAALDYMSSLYRGPGWQPQSVLLAVDEPTLKEIGGMRNVRKAFAEVLDMLAKSPPRAVVSDITLSDEPDPAEDLRLEEAFRKTHNLVLPCDLTPAGWEDPLPRFGKWAVAVGHVHAEPDKYDAVTRRILLEYIAQRDRRWALALQAFRLSTGAREIVESPDDLQIGSIVIPAPRADSRSLRIRYLPPFPEPGSVPRISFKELKADPRLAERMKDRVVFVGVTALSAAHDRLLTPYSYGATMPGVEIHANAFETLAHGRFFRDAPDSAVFGFSLLLAVAAGLTFVLRSGWQAYAIAGLLLMSAHLVPWWMFRRDVVFSWFAPASAAWLSVVASASYEYFVVRRRLRKSESDRARYQQAIHFVTHEMRTPLTAIQGSSELMSRYNLNDEKRKQLATTINSESKRLARMIQTFLDVERLSAGEMELKRELFPMRTVVDACLDRTRALAERKQIRVHLAEVPEVSLTGDRELMEYAVYNLLTNAIKYSPAGTEVRVGGRRDGDRVHLSVEDQGIGMDAKELKDIFKKFYRTKKAEASGEAGTGIGLSIVEQIVTHHGGSIEVESTPGEGSCFTLVLPAKTNIGRE